LKKLNELFMTISFISDFLARHWKVFCGVFLLLFLFQDLLFDTIVKPYISSPPGAQIKLTDFLNKKIPAKNKNAALSNSEIIDILSPVKRSDVHSSIETAALRYGLQNLSYSISKETPVSITLSDNTHHLAISSWTVSAHAPTDISTYQFINSLNSIMKGKVLVRYLNITRTASNISDINVHFEAKGEWLSSGSNHE